LRQHFAVLQSRHPQPRFKAPNRFFWVFLHRLWPGWRTLSRPSFAGTGQDSNAIGRGSRGARVCPSAVQEPALYRLANPLLICVPSNKAFE
jgi:hypothetical protein